MVKKWKTSFHKILTFRKLTVVDVSIKLFVKLS